MRNDPAEDMSERPWAVTSGVLFAQLSVAAGTLVVNDPASLANAVNKTYFQHFPEAVRPRTLISRDPDDISAFVKEMGAGAVLKPLQGSGGTSVFFVSNDESPNLNQMIEAVGRDGYIVAQEVLPEAEHGDVRLFLMNGEPLVAGGHHAAFRRVNPTTDRRSNMRVGGEPETVEVDDAMLHVAEAVRPKLLADGMFLVGLDIVGDKLMEVNVFSPGGLGTCEALYEDQVHRRRDRRARAQGRSARPVSGHVVECEPRDAVTRRSANGIPTARAGARPMTSTQACGHGTRRR